MTYLFLKKSGDGLWTSTQATLQVLRVLADAFASAGGRAPRLAAALDGADLELPRQRPGTAAAPLAVALGKGQHRLRVEGTSAGWGLVQATVRHHVAWDEVAELPSRDDRRLLLRLKMSALVGDGLRRRSRRRIAGRLIDSWSWPRPRH